MYGLPSTFNALWAVFRNPAVRQVNETSIALLFAGTSWSSQLSIEMERCQEMEHQFGNQLGEVAEAFATRDMT